MGNDVISAGGSEEHLRVLNINFTLFVLIYRHLLSPGLFQAKSEIYNFLF